MKNLEMHTIEPFHIQKGIMKFQEISKSKLTLVDGLRDHSLHFLKLHDPSEIPADIVLIAVVKDGDYANEELTRPFDIWGDMEKHYVKLYQSKNFMNGDGATWFFLLFKKRMLIQKNREVLNSDNEQSLLFDESIFKNYY